MSQNLKTLSSAGRVLPQAEADKVLFVLAQLPPPGPAQTKSPKGVYNRDDSY